MMMVKLKKEDGGSLNDGDFSTCDINEKKKDFTAVACWALDKDGKIYLIEMAKSLEEMKEKLSVIDEKASVSKEGCYDASRWYFPKYVYIDRLGCALKLLSTLGGTDPPVAYYWRTAGSWKVRVEKNGNEIIARQNPVPMHHFDGARLEEVTEEVHSESNMEDVEPFLSKNWNSDEM